MHIQDDNSHAYSMHEPFPASSTSAEKGEHIVNMYATALLLSFSTFLIIVCMVSIFCSSSTRRPEQMVLISGQPIPAYVSIVQENQGGTPQPSHIVLKAAPPEYSR